MNPLGTFTFDGPVGPLEGLYRADPGIPERSVVVCHPHPLHGGSMHNRVVHRTAKTFRRLGFAVLRFNFRGVGCSAGAFSDGHGEAEDVRAALDWIASEGPGSRIVLCGFSFGNVIGLPVAAEDDRVSHLVGLGTPTGRFPFDSLAHVHKPKLFIQGDRDEYGPVGDLRDGLSRIGQPWTLTVVPGADHFFTDRLDNLDEAIVEFFGGL